MWYQKGEQNNLETPEVSDATAYYMVLSELRTRRKIFPESGECLFQNERSVGKMHVQRGLFGGKVGNALAPFLTVS
jgi:hypothetical protein